MLILSTSLLVSGWVQPHMVRVMLSSNRLLRALQVSLDLVKGIQKAKLPISVTLDGAQQVVSEAWGTAVGVFPSWFTVYGLV